MNSYFEKLNGFHYKLGIEAIKHRYQKCIVLKSQVISIINFECVCAKIIINR